MTAEAMSPEAMSPESRTSTSTTSKWFWCPIAAATTWRRCSSWPQNLSVVVVDNSANTDGLAELVDRFANLRYLSGGGQGFARAANLGAFSSEKPFVVFVNPDCRPTPDQILALARGWPRTTARSPTPPRRSTPTG